MSYQIHTHNLIVKNSNEILSNSAISYRTSDTAGEVLIDAFIKNNIDNRSAKTIVVPGFINLHAHLAYTNIEINSQELFSWLKVLMQKIQQTDEGFSPSTNAIAGLKELIASGCTYVIDNSSHPLESYEAFKTLGLKGLIGLEVFGSNPEASPAIFAQTLSKLSSLPQDPNIEFTLSPHASYDVSVELWKKCLAWCKANGKKLLTHIAESEAEEKWFQDKDHAQTKVAKEFWQSINTLDSKLNNWKKYKSSIDFMEQEKLLDRCLLITHMVHASKADLETVSKYNIPLVTCPRSNLFLQNGLANYDLWHDLNIEFGLGTDSKASNYSLDIREELKYIKNLNAKEKFEMLTSKAAKILGKDHSIGSLEAGKSADFVILETVPADLDLDSLNIFDLIIDPSLTKVKSVVVNGNIVHQSSKNI